MNGTTIGLTAVLLAQHFLLLSFHASGERALAQDAEVRREVLIYYANENAPDAWEAKNYETLLGWLRASEVGRVQKMADSIERDTVAFPAAVDEEIDLITDRLTRSGLDIGAALFTNRLVRAGEFLVFDPRQGRVETCAIRIAPHENPILAGNPLSDPATFARCLRSVAERFDPAAHSFVLVTKSHGSVKMALTPRVIAAADDFSREQILAMVEAEPSEGPAAPQLPRLGITRQEYFDLLGAAGRDSAMRFSLVFAESCQGILPQDLKLKLPENVGRVYTTGNEQTTYRNLDYARAFDRCERGDSLAEALEEQLAAGFPGIMHTPPERLRRQYLFYALAALSWVPLVLWVAWLVRRRRGRRRASDAG